jgi:hypothetical protein
MQLNFSKGNRNIASLKNGVVVKAELRHAALGRVRRFLVS